MTRWHVLFYKKKTDSPISGSSGTMSRHRAETSNSPPLAMSTTAGPGPFSFSWASPAHARQIPHSIHPESPGPQLHGLVEIITCDTHKTLSLRPQLHGLRETIACDTCQDVILEARTTWPRGNHCM